MFESSNQASIHDFFWGISSQAIMSYKESFVQRPLADKHVNFHLVAAFRFCFLMRHLAVKIVKGKKCFRTCNKVSRSFSIHFWIHITSLKLDFSQFYLKKFPLTLITSLEKGKQVCTFYHLEKLYDMSSDTFLKP